MLTALPVSMVRFSLASIVIAVPEPILIAPALVIRMSSGPAPPGFDVAIGVVRAVEITTSAIAPEAAIRGAIATAVASRIRIR
ncbi:MAG TPA: hypothetical protein VM348_04645 [Brevundimonas sp.]|nr:hypothetical protein [Brevundimonas sp.]